MMNKNKVVLFDIDYTLFDVGYFDKHFHKEIAALLGLDEKLVRKLSVETINELFEKDIFLDIDKYLVILAGKLDKRGDVTRMEDILFNSDFFRKGFYKEVGQTLKEIEKVAKIGIFSTGDLKFQWAKIDKSGFKHFFNKDIVYIGPDKLDLIPVLKNKHESDNVYLVDDKPVIINKIKKDFPSVFTIWIKQGRYIDQAREIEDFKPDAMVENLSEVVKIIKKS